MVDPMPVPPVPNTPLIPFNSPPISIAMAGFPPENGWVDWLTVPPCNDVARNVGFFVMAAAPSPINCCGEVGKKTFDARLPRASNVDLVLGATARATSEIPPVATPTTTRLTIFLNDLKNPITLAHKTLRGHGDGKHTSSAVAEPVEIPVYHLVL